MHITCRREDQELFKRIGFRLDFDQLPNSALIEMVDHEANYAHNDEMPTNVPYFGHHDAGGEYADGVFACDGRRYAYVEAGHCGGFVVAWNTKGNRPHPKSLQRVRRYLSVQDKVAKVFEKLAQPSALEVSTA
jgi:hypothetical protein